MVLPMQLNVVTNPTTTSYIFGPYLPVPYSLSGGDSFNVSDNPKIPTVDGPITGTHSNTLLLPWLSLMTFAEIYAI